MNESHKFSPEVRERAVRMVLEPCASERFIAEGKPGLVSLTRGRQFMAGRTLSLLHECLLRSFGDYRADPLPRSESGSNETIIDMVD